MAQRYKDGQRVHDYYSAFHFVKGGRNKETRPIQPNTTVVLSANHAETNITDDLSAAVRLHQTEVVVFHDDGRITLDTGGWFTVTTKDRITEYLPNGLYICTRQGRWFLGRYERQSGHSIICPFEDGMTFDPNDLDGLRALAQSYAAQVAEEDAVNAEVKKLVTSYVRAMKVQHVQDALAEGGSRCEGCAGIGSRNTDEHVEHLVEHVQTHTYTFWIIYAALKNAGYRDPHTIMHLADDGKYGMTSIRRAVRKDMLNRFMVGAVTRRKVALSLVASDD